SFSGEFFTIRDMHGEPVPSEIPIMIGGTGPKLLGIAAREADIVSVNLLKAPDISDRALAERVGWVRDAAGAPFASIELQLPLAPEGSFLMRALAARHSAEALAASPMILSGGVAEMADKLTAIRAQHGVSAFMVPMSELHALAPVIEEVS